MIHFVVSALTSEMSPGTSLGTNCPMFANCLGFGDVREVRSSVLGQIEMFGSVRSSILKFGEHFRTFWALF